jgi:hypothetical protein
MNKSCTEKGIGSGQYFAVVWSICGRGIEVLDYG